MAYSLDFHPPPPPLKPLLPWQRPEQRQQQQELLLRRHGPLLEMITALLQPTSVLLPHRHLPPNRPLLGPSLRALGRISSCWRWQRHWERSGRSPVYCDTLLLWVHWEVALIFH